MTYLTHGTRTKRRHWLAAIMLVGGVLIADLLIWAVLALAGWWIWGNLG